MSGVFDDYSSGIFVSKIKRLSPADKAGLEVGDKIVEVSFLFYFILWIIWTFENGNTKKILVAASFNQKFKIHLIYS